MSKYHKNERHLCLVAYSFTKLSQNVWPKPRPKHLNLISINQLLRPIPCQKYNMVIIQTMDIYINFSENEKTAFLSSHRLMEWKTDKRKWTFNIPDNGIYRVKYFEWLAILYYTVYQTIIYYMYQKSILLHEQIFDKWDKLMEWEYMWNYYSHFVICSLETELRNMLGYLILGLGFLVLF